MLPGAMRLTLYVVHGSHPCAAVEKALEIKGLQYRVIEWPPTLHPPFQLILFGVRTVPGLRISPGGRGSASPEKVSGSREKVSGSREKVSGSREKVSGSRAIMRRLDQLQPEPALFPADPAKRAAVEEAERWGDETFQPLGRTLLWNAFHHNHSAMVGYAEHSRIPLAGPTVRVAAPMIARIGFRVNGATDETAARDRRALPGYLDTIDGWIADGTIGDAEHPNAADLQILSTVRLLMTLGDLREMIAARPSGRLAAQVFPQADGDMPAGSLAAA
jgi:glutathione S-transferase